MTLEEFPKEYQRLVKQVQNINWKAAEYLVDEAPKLPEFNPSYALNRCFVFKGTPQGLMYWRGVLDILERKRRGYADLVQRIADLGVSPETIDYLNNEAMDIPNFDLSEQLYKAFDWKETPQGPKFWACIDDLLESEEPPGNQSPPLEPEPQEPIYPDMEAVQRRFLKLLEFKREHCPDKVFDTGVLGGDGAIYLREPNKENCYVYYSHGDEEWKFADVGTCEDPTIIYFDLATAKLLVEKLNFGEFEL